MHQHNLNTRIHILVYRRFSPPDQSQGNHLFFTLIDHSHANGLHNRNKKRAIVVMITMEIEGPIHAEGILPCQSKVPSSHRAYEGLHLCFSYTRFCRFPSLRHNVQRDKIHLHLALQMDNVFKNQVSSSFFYFD